MHEDMLDALLALMPAGTSIGSLPPSGGVATYWGPGAPTDQYLDRGSYHDAALVVNSKNLDQRAGLSALSTIHSQLTQRADYPEGSNWRITNIRTKASPNFLGMDEDGRSYLWGSILGVTFYVRGV